MGKRTKAKSLTLPLGDIAYPDQLESEIQEEIVKKLLSNQGTQEDREKLFGGHIRLAINIAARYALQTQGRDDDLVEEALLALWNAILEIPYRLVDTNFTPWVTTKIHSNVYEYITKDSLVPIPVSTLTRHNRNGDRMIMPQCKSIHGLGDEKRFDPEESIETKQMIRNRKRFKSLEVGNNHSMMEIREMLQQAVKTEIEMRVISYRERGFNDAEIAAKINRSIAYVSKVKRTVEARFEALEKCNGKH